MSNVQALVEALEIMDYNTCDAAAKELLRLEDEAIAWKVVSERNLDAAFDLNEENKKLREAKAELLGALKEITEDYADRFDLDDPSTNRGIKHCVKLGRAAIQKHGGQP